MMPRSTAEMLGSATENNWDRAARYMRLAEEFQQRADREPDDEIRATFLDLVVQWISLADDASDPRRRHVPPELYRRSFYCTPMAA